MTYRVDLTARATRDLRRLFLRIDAAQSGQAREWFNGLEQAILTFDEHPARNPATPEDDTLRHLLYGRRRDTYRVIYCIDEERRVVTVLHIRHGARRPMERAGDE